MFSDSVGSYVNLMQDLIPVIKDGTIRMPLILDVGDIYDDLDRRHSDYYFFFGFHTIGFAPRTKKMARWCQDCIRYHQAKDGNRWVAYRGFSGVQSASKVYSFFIIFNQCGCYHSFFCTQLGWRYILNYNM